ncbi:hypothetical protein BpHYR1_048022 [Brachionus plicatilis]|uniref:Uncharacterized protein n=1 Tax=Brachionus plicatilis TaxID=10195 RepID=A0A3M7T9T6_BRAPC|nr:hypothetical protein BpHYR1_048022 [Brachionus plicatilis]
MSGERKSIRLQIDLPIDDAYLLKKISCDQISNIQFRFSLKALNKQNASLNSYEMSSLSSSSASDYSSASDSLMLSLLSSDLKANYCMANESKNAVNVYDKLSFRKICHQSGNYSITNDLVRNRVENIYEEIIYSDKCPNEKNFRESNEYFIPTGNSRSKTCKKMFKKEYSLNQIMDNLNQLTTFAQKQEEMAQCENSNLTCSEPIYV